MATLTGYASIDERGHISGGQAGDQKQVTSSGNDYNGEVKCSNWYNFGYTTVLRWKDRENAKKYAKFIQDVCNSRYVGYDQVDKRTLFNTLKPLKFDVSKLKTNVEVDYSELTRVGLYAVGVIIETNIYTGNMIDMYMKTGEFTKLTESKYLTTGDYLMTGDIMFKPGSHTSSALEMVAR